MVQLLWRTNWQFPKYLNVGFPFDPAIPPLGIYPPKLKAGTLHPCLQYYSQ